MEVLEGAVTEHSVLQGRKCRRLGSVVPQHIQRSCPKDTKPKELELRGNLSGPLGMTVMSVYVVQKPQD